MKPYFHGNMATDFGCIFKNRRSREHGNMIMVIEKENFNQEIRPKQRRHGKLSTYKGNLTEWLINDKHAPRNQQHTTRRVFDCLKELYGDELNANDSWVILGNISHNTLLII